MVASSLGAPEGPGATCSMLVERLVCEACQRLLRLAESSIPALVPGQLFEDRGGEIVLLPLREAASDLEGLPQRIAHLRSHVGKSITQTEYVATRPPGPVYLFVQIDGCGSRHLRSRNGGVVGVPDPRRPA